MQESGGRWLAVAVIAGFVVCCGGEIDRTPTPGPPGGDEGGTAGSSAAVPVVGAAGAPPILGEVGGGASHVTVAMSFPYGNSLLSHGYLIDVDTQDQAVLVGPADPSGVDPGLSVRWLTTAGTVVRETVFARGVAPDAIAVGPDDCIWMAGQLLRDASFGGPTLPTSGTGFYLVKLASDGLPTPRPKTARYANLAVDLAPLAPRRTQKEGQPIRRWPSCHSADAEGRGTGSFAGSLPPRVSDRLRHLAPSQ